MQFVLSLHFCASNTDIYYVSAIGTDAAHTLIHFFLDVRQLHEKLQMNL